MGDARCRRGRRDHGAPDRRRAASLAVSQRHEPTRCLRSGGRSQHHERLLRHSYSTGTFGIGDYGQYGYKEIVCNGPHGGKVTFGVFRAQAAAARAVAQLIRGPCQSVEPAGGVPVSGLRWLAFADLDADVSSLEDAGGSRVPCD